MRIIYSASLLKEAGIVPSLFYLGKYIVYFWSNENGEPIHVHVCEGKPMPNATKVWLTKAGGCILAHNRSRIPQRELNNIMAVITVQFVYICMRWKQHFKVDEISFYC